MTHSDVTVDLPESLESIAQDFAALSARDRLVLLLDFSDELPELPERYQGHAELLERVDECQSPLFLVVEMDGAQDALVTGSDTWPSGSFCPWCPGAPST